MRGTDLKSRQRTPTVKFTDCENLSGLAGVKSWEERVGETAVYFCAGGGVWYLHRSFIRKIVGCLKCGNSECFPILNKHLCLDLTLQLQFFVSLFV